MVRVIVTRQGGGDVPMNLAALSLSEWLLKGIKKTLDNIDTDKDWFVAFVGTGDAEKVKEIARDWAKDHYRTYVENYEGEGLVCSYGGLCWYCPYAVYRNAESEGEPCRLGFVEV
jgi:hypothetical protein